MSFKLREKLTFARTDVKFHGELNTTTGEWRHDVQVLNALLRVTGFKSNQTKRKANDKYFGLCGFGGRVHYNTRSACTSYKVGVWGRSEKKWICN